MLTHACYFELQHSGLGTVLICTACCRYYASVDAFVLPSRGEGWGRPHVEAMSMGLPIIATNWSGTTEYLDESVGYPIKVRAAVT